MTGIIALYTNIEIMWLRMVGKTRGGMGRGGGVEGVEGLVGVITGSSAWVPNPPPLTHPYPPAIGGYIYRG